MNPVCRWRQRMMARYAALGRALPAASPLAAHLARCERCRLAWYDLRDTASDLSRSLMAPVPSPSFTEEVWDRLAAARPARVRWGMAPLLAATALALLALCGLLWKSGGPAFDKGENRRIAHLWSAATSRRFEGHGLSNTVYKPVRHRTPKDEDLDRSPRRITQRIIAVVMADKPRHFHRALHKSVIRIAQAPPKSVDKPIHSLRAAALRPVKRQGRWTDWGVWYESWGDYHGAAAAYGKALEQEPVPSVAFAAGRAAECAGDITLALDYYSRLLSHNPGAKTQPEKGTMIWNDAYDTA